jgi:hypothetical protein
MWLPYDQERYEMAKLYSEMPDLIRAQITLTGYEYLGNPYLISVSFL